MKTIIAWASMAGMLCGCQSLKYLGGMDSVPASGVKGGQELRIELVSPSGRAKILAGNSDPVLRTAVDQCKSPQAAAGGVIAATLVSSLGKFIFDAWIERERANLERYKKMAAPPPYSDTSIVTGKIDEIRCVILVRETIARDAAGKETGRSVGLIVVLHATRHVGKDGMKAFTFTPIYVKANDAVAFVARETPTLAIAVSLSLRGIAKASNGLPTTVQIGESVVSVEGISVGPESVAVCSPKAQGKPVCPTSGFFPLPSIDAGEMALTVSVAERGSLPTANMEIADLELKALKDAIGPGIRDALKEWYK